LDSEKKDTQQEKFDVDLSPIRDFAREMDSFFNHSFNQVNSIFNLRSFRVNVEETDSDVIIRAELPGYKRDQIQIEVLGNVLRIAVEERSTFEERDDLQKRYARRKSHQQKVRSITLPFEIPESETKASFEDGLLRVVIPKDNSKRKYIDIE